MPKKKKGKVSQRQNTIVKVYDFFSRRRILFALGIIIAVAFTVRVVLPLRVVFGHGFVNFIATDSYNRMYYARQISGLPVFNGYIYAIQNSLLFSWIVGTLGRFLPLEIVGAWLPPLLAAGTVAVVYLIGANLFNSFVGIMAALFVAVIPSEFYHRTQLGFADHHALEVLLMAVMVYLVIKALRETTALNRYTWVCGLVLFLYLFNWTGGLLMVGIFGLLALGIIKKRVFYKVECKQPVLTLTLVSFIGVFLFMIMGGYVRYLWWLLPNANVALVEHASGLTSETLATIIMPLSERTTSELMPLLFPFGKFNLAVVVTNMHLFAITFILGLVFLWRWRKDNINLFILIWTIVLLALTLNQRRFLYYLTLPVGLLSAWAVYELGQLFKRDSLLIMLLVTTMLVLVSMPMLRMISAGSVYNMTPEWHDALVWLKDQPDNGKVTAWSDFGHWILYTAEKTPSMLPNPGGDNIATLFLTEDDEEAQNLMTELNTGYLIIDRQTVDYKVEALQVISGLEMTPLSLARRLLDGKRVPYLELIYESENIRVYETDYDYKGE